MYKCSMCGSVSPEPKECCGSPMKKMEETCPSCGKPISQCTCK